ncbi:hypothetical protein AVEN_4322-1 [Araneus ventricosus]|uniref:Uncharacterized protein n=1 Tax=Araneus ventricosus TaxID=182803 RepID=A0A4Y2GDY1_ARAVE|nr:hypothetical protein AVEN_4322-1 [Araneus ventricosus]
MVPFFSRSLHPGMWSAEIQCASEVARMTHPNRGWILPRRRSLVIPFFELWTNLYFTFRRYLDCVKLLHGLFFRLPLAKWKHHSSEEMFRLPKDLKPNAKCVRIILCL